MPYDIDPEERRQMRARLLSRMAEPAEPVDPPPDELLMSVEPARPPEQLFTPGPLYTPGPTLPAKPAAPGRKAAPYNMEKALAGKPVLGPELEGTGGSPPPPPAPIRPAVREYLEKKRGAVGDEGDAELQAAQDAAADRRLLATGNRVGAQIAAAFADQAPGTYTAGADELARRADQPLKDLEARRAAAKAKKSEAQADEDRARAQALKDPNSEQSELARQTFATLRPEQVKRWGERFKDFSAEALARVEPSIEKELERAADDARAKAAAAATASENAKNRALQIKLKEMDNAGDLARQRLANEKGAAGADKESKKAITEITDRYSNIKEQLGQLRTQVQGGGTYDLVGPHNAQLEQKLTSIATDMAKLVDPNSVARESEVAAFKKMLFEPSLWMKNSTALGVIDSFDKMVDSRLSNAYKSRGLEVPTPSTATASGFRPVTLKDGRKGLYNEATGEFKEG